MADNTLNFTIKIKDESSTTVKTITLKTEELSKSIRAVKGEADRLNSRLVNMAQFSKVFEGIKSVITQVQGAFKD